MNPSGSRKHILIIDDDAAIRLIVQTTIECLTSWSVSEATSAAEGMSKAEAEQPDLIIMDYKMPGTNGLECLNHLRANPYTQDIPVFFLTADACLAEFDQFQAAGAVGAIAKPFDPFLLVAHIIQALDWGET
jgi:two-component system, OmpR family, response regulator